MGLSVACAVLRGEPPTVFLAEDLDALHWTLATEVVARARDQDWPAPVREAGARRAARRALGRRGARAGWTTPTWWSTSTRRSRWRRSVIARVAAAELQFTPLFSLRLLVPSLRTEVTEIVTGLAMLGVGDLDWALAERPAGDGQRRRRPLGAPRRGPRATRRTRPTSPPAWANGLAFLRADRRAAGPAAAAGRVEGPGQAAGRRRRARRPAHRPRLPGQLQVPVEDPAQLVAGRPVRRLPGRAAGRHRRRLVRAWPRRASTRTSGRRSATTCPTPSSRRGRRPRPAAARRAGGGPAGEAAPAGRQGLPALRPRGGRPRPPDRWSAALPDVAARERMLWRMLRLTGAPYFVLGSSGRHVAAAAHRHPVGLAPALPS